MNYETNLLFLLTCLGLGLGSVTNTILLLISKCSDKLNFGISKNTFIGFSSGVVGGNAILIYNYLNENLLGQIIIYLNSYIFIPTFVYILCTGCVYISGHNYTFGRNCESDTASKSENLSSKNEHNSMQNPSRPVWKYDYAAQQNMLNTTNDNDLMAQFWNNNENNGISTCNSPNF